MIKILKKTLYKTYRLLNSKKNISYKKNKSEKLNNLKSSKIYKGTLYVEYVSKLKTDKNGKEYAYLPKTKFITNDKEEFELPSLIYTKDISLEQEKTGLYQGYGKLKGEFKKKQNLLILNSFETFNPTIEEIITETNLSQANFGLIYLSIKTSDGAFQCKKEDVPFKFSPYINSLDKKILKDQLIRIKTMGRKLGKVYKIKNQWNERNYWVQYKESSWDFSNCNPEEIHKIFNNYKEDKKYEKLVKDLKNMKTFTSYTNIKRRFKEVGSPITDNELNNMFFHSGYDEDIFNLLKDKSSETFVNNLSFIFKIKTKKGRFKYVWEVPNRALATYIFNDKLKYTDLFNKLSKTPRMIIRQNKEIQEKLDFSGFIIHTNFESWNEKFKTIIK